MAFNEEESLPGEEVKEEEKKGFLTKAKSKISVIKEKVKTKIKTEQQLLLENLERESNEFYDYSFSEKPRELPTEFLHSAI